jgi:hypothetical protein
MLFPEYRIARPLRLTPLSMTREEPNCGGSDDESLSRTAGYFVQLPIHDCLVYSIPSETIHPSHLDNVVLKALVTMIPSFRSESRFPGSRSPGTSCDAYDTVRRRWNSSLRRLNSSLLSGGVLPLCLLVTLFQELGVRCRRSGRKVGRLALITAAANSMELQFATPTRESVVKDESARANG